MEESRIRVKVDILHLCYLGIRVALGSYFFMGDEIYSLGSASAATCTGHETMASFSATLSVSQSRGIDSWINTAGS